MGRKHEKKTKHKSSSGQMMKGTLDITRSGIGYVMVDDLPVDILVRPADFNTALHGDTVRVKIIGGGKQSGRMTGEVVDVLQRRQTEFLGKLEMGKNFAFFVAESDKPMPDIYIPLSNLREAKDNEKVIVKIVEWEKNKKPVGQVVQVMDSRNEGDLAMKEILMENGFPLFFPDDVMEEAERIPHIDP